MGLGDMGLNKSAELHIRMNSHVTDNICQMPSGQ